MHTGFFLKQTDFLYVAESYDVKLERNYSAWHEMRIILSKDEHFWFSSWLKLDKQGKFILRRKSYTAESEIECQCLGQSSDVSMPHFLNMASFVKTHLHAERE